MIMVIQIKDFLLSYTQKQKRANNSNLSATASETQYETIITTSEEDDHDNPNKRFPPQL